MRDLLQYAKECELSYTSHKEGQVYRAGSDVSYLSDWLGGKLITIRGSDGNDMIDNIKIKKDSSSIGKVHHGFYKGMKSLYSAMRKDLERSRGEVFYITGHSRGGAIALLLSLYLRARGYNIAILYTFGAPRSICKGTKSGINHIRVVNNGDRVPMLPRRYMGYKHDCKAIKLKGSWWSKLWILGYSDHMIEYYIEAIERNI